MPYQLPTLRYTYDALEPFIPAETLRRHHAIHHQAYLDALNAALERHPDLGHGTIEELLRDLPLASAKAQADLTDLAGGYANHQFQWKVISPGQGGIPTGALAAAIETSFGSFAQFREKFIAAALAHVGSGWAFLAVPRLGIAELEILVLPGNGSVLPIRKPGVLICDLWEHAYDAAYPADRAGYLEAYFQLIDWPVCAERFASFAAGVMHIK